MSNTSERATELLRRDSVHPGGRTTPQTIAWVLGDELGFPDAQILVVMLFGALKREAIHPIRRWLLRNLGSVAWGAALDVTGLGVVDPNSRQLLTDAVAYGRSLGRRVAVIGVTATMTYTIRHEMGLDVLCLRTWSDFRGFLGLASADGNGRRGKLGPTPRETTRGLSRPA